MSSLKVPLLPKQSGEFISKLAKNVSIQSNGVVALAKEIVGRLKDNSLSVQNFSQHELHPQVADRAAVDWIFTVDTLNFSFWAEGDGSRKWEVEFNGKKHTGYFALCAAVNRALQEGVPVTRAEFCASVGRQALGQVLRSASGVEAPLLGERALCLNEAGRVLLDKHQGSFVNCIKKAENSAQRLLKIIVEDFPSYRDEAEYEGCRVSFYKRAQILIGDIWACFEGKGFGYFADIDTITMFADYRVPQSLVHFGVLRYSDELMAKLKSGVPLESGGRDEVEIRGCSIRAVELVRRRALELEPGLESRLNCVLVDHFLWDFRREHAARLEAVPFHRTRCVYY
ncbi:queuosine 5'-phosphate N-glycosylase/hydrolase [Bacillus rossius redtenbacheri]|uniref:queuosine 5'-phosphate N-glycosylase/hydrolase n=1 Tax=Bacillus rossius redtenbacheri TaxID=93214 RepID=UPI002FDDC327